MVATKSGRVKKGKKVLCVRPYRKRKSEYSYSDQGWRLILDRVAEMVLCRCRKTMA